MDFGNWGRGRGLDGERKEEKKESKFTRKVFDSFSFEKREISKLTKLITITV